MAAFGQRIRLEPEPLRSLAFGSISATYAGVGTSFDHPTRILLIQNLTDVTLLFSLNGVDDHFPLLSNSVMLLDVTANKTREEGLYFAEGSRVYVKESGTPASGSVYVTTFYGAE